MINIKVTDKQKIIEQKVEFLVPGMEVARDIHTDSGSILAPSSTIVNQSLIKQLHNWKVEKVAIITEINDNPIADPKIQKFMNSYNQSVTIVQQAFENIRQTQEVPIETFAQTADDIVDSVTTTGNAIDQLYNLPKCDDYTFRHNVNVSAIAALIATWLKFPPESISAIALSALLHDVGKSQLPDRILHRSHLLSPEDYELYKTHVTVGYDLVSRIPNIAQSVLLGILDHHEREDGTGYPKQLKGEEIHPYAKIIMVADMFDEELTIKCDTPGALSPYFSLEKVRDSIYLVDAKIGMTFINNMLNFLSGNVVALSDGQQGRVAFINKDKPSQSIVRMEDGTVIDLSETKDLYIQYVIR